MSNPSTMPVSRSDDRYDALVIGAGPAGLSAAIYLARACRSVLVLDCQRPGRSDWSQQNHNYLGFPDGISVTELAARGRAQAERYGARFWDGEVHEVTKDGDHFLAQTPGGAIAGRTVVIATGVTDDWVEFPGYKLYIGRSVHWCIVCDGYEMQGRRVLVVGHDAHTAVMAMQMRHFTERVTVLTNRHECEIPDESVAALEARGIPLVVDVIAGARARTPGYLEAVLLEGGEELEVDHLFSVQGARPNSGLVRGLGVEMSAEGYIKVDTEAHTSVHGVYAAGDVTRLFSHQIVTAAHEGAMAANAINYQLFQEEQARETG